MKLPGTLPGEEAGPQTATLPTVLFVDDEPKVLSGLRNAMHKYPMRILTATSADRALEVLDHEAVDVIVSDERMPHVSGSQLLAVVRRQYPHTVRIVLTGHASMEAAVRAINEGEVYRFLTKPCDPVDLAQTIQNGLQLRHLAQHSTRLLAKVRQQESALREIESAHPGISKVDVDESGAILLEAGDVTELLRLLERENR